MKMLDRKEFSQIEHVMNRKSQRLHLTESLHDYFAVNPKAKYHNDPVGLPPDDSERSETSTTAKSNSTSLDETFHERITENRTTTARPASSPSPSSLDTTFHSQRTYIGKSGISPKETVSFHQIHASENSTLSSRTRKVRWLTDMDPSDGIIE